MTGIDPVERFLLDAERAARRGDRDVALELIALALDTAPGDPAVLVRAHAIRAMAPEDERILGDNENIASLRVLDVPDPIEEIVVNPEPKTSLDDQLVKNSVSDSEEVALQGDNRFSPPVDEWLDATLFDISQGALSQSVPQVRSRLVWLLWAALGIVVVGGIGILRDPQRIQDFILVVQRYFDPVEGAKHAIQAGDLDRAEILLHKALEERRGAPESYLLLAEVRLVRGDSSTAAKIIVDGLSTILAWEDLLRAARLVAQAGDVIRAAEIYLLAFEHGAPPELWREIAAAQQRAGHEQQAQHLLDLLQRTEQIDTVESRASR